MANSDETKSQSQNDLMNDLLKNPFDAKTPQATKLLVVKRHQW
nr:hypothetical protein [Agrilactobacillus composti]